MSSSIAGWTNLKAVRLAFAPLSAASTSARTLLYRIQTDAFKKANPNCQLAVDCSTSVPEPSIEVTLKDNKKTRFATHNMTAADVIQRVSKLTKRIAE